MKRYTPFHEDPSSLSALLTASQFASRLPDRPHVSTVHRWATRGALIETPDGPVRVLLPHKRCGQKYLFTVAWYLAWVTAQTELHGSGALAEVDATASRKRKRKEGRAVSSSNYEPPAILSRYGLNPEQG